MSLLGACGLIEDSVLVYTSSQTSRNWSDQEQGPDVHHKSFIPLSGKLGVKISSTSDLEYTHNGPICSFSTSDSLDGIYCAGKLQRNHELLVSYKEDIH